MRPRDLTGQRFGRLEAVKFVGREKNKAMWECACDCGKTVVISLGNLHSGNTKSCGCERSEACRLREQNKTRSEVTTLRRERKSESRSWYSMHNRCYNPKTPGYEHYGGRGIKVCNEWHEDAGFVNFCRDLGPRPDGTTLNRIDNDGDYEPGNCEWASVKVQQRNKRTTVRIACGDTELPLIDVCEANGVQVKSVRKRIRKGQSFEEALSKYRPLHLLTISYEGVQRPVNELARLLGVRYSSLWRYAKKGATAEEALVSLTVRKPPEK